VTRGLRGLNNEQRCDLYTSLSIIRIMELRRRLARHLARKMDLGEIGWGSVYWTRLAKGRDK
jgi:hypothetical protein